MAEQIRVGLIGAGYIADWHAAALKATPEAQLVAVCDRSRPAAEALAHKHGLEVFDSVAALIDSGCCDAVHILTPPGVHAAIAQECLAGGLHVLIEKPVAETAADVAAIRDCAAEHGKIAHVGHNFLGLPSYERMRTALRAGAYGRISAADITWALPLPPIRSGPYGLWMLRQPGNLVLELGPHLLAPVVDLFGKPEIHAVESFKQAALPGSGTVPQSIRVLGRAGHVDLSITISLVETTDDRSILLRGSSARVRLDLAQDTLIADHDNASEIVLNPARRQMALAFGHLREGLRNFATQVASLNRKTPYGLSFQNMNRTLYQTLQRGTEPDPRFSITSALTVMESLEEITAKLPDQGRFAPAKVKSMDGTPDVMVIGGTGFIGRVLTRKLAADGHRVRVLSRGQHSPFADIADQVETRAVSLKDTPALTEAMAGIDTVYNLAKYEGASWQDCLDNEVAPLMGVADAVLAAGVRKLVYTGTIASYDMSDPNRVITEDTDFGDMETRNLYARSKAECEARLLARHAADGLDVVIARPGIVVGEGGPLQHWGIGRWHGAGAVRIWGNGRNILPFVLVDDVIDGLILMAQQDTAGQSFNLIGDPMLSARDYFAAIRTHLGADIRVSQGNLTTLWISDAVKYQLKKSVLGRKDAIRASRPDWKSRAHLSPFDNSHAKQVLGWSPEPDKAQFIKRAITEANLFGF